MTGDDETAVFHVERAITSFALRAVAWTDVGEVTTFDADAPETIVNRITGDAGVYRIRRADGARCQAPYVRVDADGVARVAIG